MTKIIIAGSRDFNDYNLLCQYIDKLLSVTSDVEIVCGGARGADTMGEIYAKRHNLKIKYFIANWDDFGKSAGIIRNIAMGKYADCAIIFWDGKSKGSKNMINVMKGLKKQCYVVKY